MIGNKSILIIFFSCFTFASIETIDVHYIKGMDAYRNNQYDLAIQEFEIILKNNWVSSELYYNLGNAFYRKDHIAGAVWAYESCLMIYPTHQDAVYNLQLANLKVKDRMELPDPPIYLKWYMSVKELFEPSKWIIVTLSLFLLFSIITSILRIFSLKSVYYVPGIILTIFFTSLFLTFHAIWTSNSVSQGIIYNIKVEVRSEPNIFSIRLFEVHEGLKVSVNQISDNWVGIELLDGKTGWIQETEIRLIQ